MSNELTLVNDAHPPIIIYKSVKYVQEKKILKNKALKEWWNFIDSNQQNEDILMFLENASKALKADVKILLKMLK